MPNVVFQSSLGLLLGLLLVACAPTTPPTPRAERPTFAKDGTVDVPAFQLPPSALSSPQARAAQAQRFHQPVGAPDLTIDVTTRRRGLEAMMAPRVARMRELYPVDVTEQEIAGVRTRNVTPRGAAADPERVLINLHGGGFSMCADGCAMLESIPIASLGGYRVVTVDYRQAPEHRHPAAVEDVAKVYRALLDDYAPGRIGIYGCSAGGALSAQTAAWLPKHDLPQAGAIGIFGAGAVRFMSGDSAYVAGYIDGSFPPPPGPGESRADITNGYFTGANLDDPVLSPALHIEVIAKFPPTLVVTGTRAMDLSPAIVTNSALLAADVDSTLIVGEAMGHCYTYQPDLPEAQHAYQETVDFFREHLR